jgi:DNA-binding transcriptional ArsR family regulator
VPVTVISDPETATVALQPLRRRILALLDAPQSATQLAERMGEKRQLVNHHVRALERHGLVHVVSERRRGSSAERVVERTATSFLLSPLVLGEPDVAVADRLSAGYLVALAAQVIGDVAELDARATRAGKRIATLALDAEVRFRSAADRRAFAEELVEAVTAIVQRYHAADGPGRSFRLVVGAHPSPPRGANP